MNYTNSWLNVHIPSFVFGAISAIISVLVFGVIAAMFPGKEQK